MDDSRREAAGPPAVRPPGTPPAVPPTPHTSGPPAPSPTSAWKRRLTVRSGSALGIGAAALLLWPFSDWSLLPWAAGLAALVLLALLRLDRLLRGWVWHVAGLVVVAGLMLSTTPWAWALAASIGVLVAGLLQLPAWRLAAVGALLCLVSGVAFILAGYQSAEAARAANARAGEPLRQVVGESATAVLPVIAQAVEDDDAEAICRLLGPTARSQLIAAAATTECASAVAALHARSSPAPSGPSDPDPPTPTPTGATSMRIDACDTSWAAAAGEALGVILIERTPSEVERYSIARFAPC